ncbi:MAG: glycosyltransferase family 2 protein, partial [Burkholderiales bacterium]|nr:glycosyltransferase family 2 protein [Burkholderiales bacterium]
GRVDMDFVTVKRPPWLEDNLLGFLAAVDHGPDRFWIKDTSTPIWTANVAYDMRLFREDPALRFDKRFDRVGNVTGGGSDAIMFRTLLDRGVRIRYCPGMAVLHAVESWRLTRRYFLKLHYRAGLRHGQFRMPDFPRMVLGVPPFLIGQFLRQSLTTLRLLFTGKPYLIRQAMNTSNALGIIVGYWRRTHS